MRIPILASALALTVSPVLGQVRQEVTQSAEHGNAPVQLRSGHMVHLEWAARQDDTEAGRWKPILIGAGIGFIVGLGIGWAKDDPDAFFKADSLECLPPAPGDDPGTCGERDRPYQFRINGSLLGTAAGAVLGWVWTLGERRVEGAP